MRGDDLVRALLEGLNHARALLEASVHRPHRGTRWVAAFRGAQGQPVWKRTGLKDRQQALALATAWEREAQATRAVLKSRPKKPTVRVRPGSGERELGLLTQQEVAAILRISERTVREIERRAFDKLRRHPALRQFWREWTGSGLEESVPNSGRDLTRAEIAAVYGLAHSPLEVQAVQRLIRLMARQ